jgi:hypothetical protein
MVSQRQILQWHRKIGQGPLELCLSTGTNRPLSNYQPETVQLGMFYSRIKLALHSNGNIDKIGKKINNR